MKPAEEIMRVLEAFDSTQSLRAAGELAGCDHHTVAYWLARRDACELTATPGRRPRLIDEFLPKLEESDAKCPETHGELCDGLIRWATLAPRHTVTAVAVLITVVIGIVVTLVVLWIVLLIGLAWLRPQGSTLSDAARIVPDTVRLVHRLAGDPSLGRGVRLRLFVLLAYLALPIDLVPDIIPVVGYADDVIVIGVVLRSVMRHAGTEVVRQHWPGSPEGFIVLTRLCRLPGPRDDQ